MTKPRSSLARHQLSEAPSRDDRRAAAKRHWQMRLGNERDRFLFVWLDDIPGWVERQQVENLGNALYGRKGSR